ncbi:MAG: hypothetical protein ACJA02_000153, partial [Myxococcota bacterium]
MLIFIKKESLRKKKRLSFYSDFISPYLIANMNNFFRIFVITLLAISLSSCSYRPIFNPNYKYRSVGDEVAQSDADLCMEEAKEYLKASKRKRVAKETARGIGWGSIAGGIFGFIIGGDVKGLVRGVAVGAGTG